MQIDLFCRVVDNFGDAGVAWRLARQCANEHGCDVRVFIDDLGVLQKIAPEKYAGQGAISIFAWECAQHETLVPAAQIFATFGCRLPDKYLAKMARMRPHPVWINVEYLSAESWVESHHRLPSVHPGIGLREYFFYPGFTENTGGLIRERDAISDEICAAGIGDIPAPARAPHAMTARALEVSLFCYPTDALSGLIDAWNIAAQKVNLYIPEGKMTAHLGLRAARRVGRVNLIPIPFTDQIGYDALLRQCDFNVVRGEDSLVRALWAGKPFLWHLYPQAGDAHLVKLNAFCDQFCAAGIEARTAIPAAQFLQDWRALMMAWNQNDAQGVAKQSLACAANWPHWVAQSRVWRKQLVAQPDLVTQLFEFAKTISGGLQ